VSIICYFYKDSRKNGIGCYIST